MVGGRPSSRLTVGFQPSFSPAREMSGHRRTGSSWGQGGVNDAGAAPGELEDLLGQLEDGELAGIAQVDRTDEPVHVHRPDEGLDEVGDVAERARLAPVAVNRQGLALERLDDEVADDPPVVHGHPRPVGVEDAGDPRLDPVLAVVVHHQGLGHALPLVVTAPDADGVDVAPVGLGLGMDLGVPVNLGGRGQEDTGPDPLGEAEHVDGPHDRGLDRLDGVLLVVDGRGRAGQVVDLVHLDEQGVDDVVADELEIGVREEMPDVVLATRRRSCRCRRRPLPRR